MRKTTLAVIVTLLLLQPVFADDIVAHFFYGDGCPHCSAEEPVLEEFEVKYPDLLVNRYETWHNKTNAELFYEISEACGTTVTGVPTLFIGEDVIVGFNDKITPGQIEDAIIKCTLMGCDDPILKTSCEDLQHQHPIANNTMIILPLFGQVDTSEISLPIFTFIIGLLDGFNPCAMWVLTFLLTLLIYAKDRKKILLIGGIFVATSGIIYFIFMSAWLNFFLIVGYVDIMRIIIALVAVVAGLINVKDFFWYKKGVSLTIPDKYKPKLFSKMRSLVKEQATTSMIIGTVLLATFANLIELLCTAGFPAIYTRILTLQELPSITYYGYLIFYNMVYVLPLAVIVGIFAYSMGKRKFTEKHGRILKIIGGALMLILGLVLLIKPELLSFG